MASFSDTEGENYEVKEILDVRGRGRNTEYLVKWQGFDSDEDTWEPAKNVRHASAAIQAFEEKRLHEQTTPARKRTQQVQKEEQTTSRTGRSVTRKTTITKVETRTVSGAQSESSSPESSPLLGRRQIKTEYKQITSNTNQPSKSASKKNRGQGILELSPLDLPILVLLTCILFIILTFVVSQK